MGIEPMRNAFVSLRDISRRETDRRLLEAGEGIEPSYNAFAERRLTTWLSGHIYTSFLIALFVVQFLENVLF
ncbi:MAG: hypothetical protein UW11_C0005G0004 [Parcubacteria group bacterium GW2011_GWA2_43_9b]|nr:MAG: hypothetical protein UW11_C0005G0004 [Parcubacteria group bacterium GW2011_GWA2_43_9b]